MKTKFSNFKLPSLNTSRDKLKATNKYVRLIIAVLALSVLVVSHAEQPVLAALPPGQLKVFNDDIMFFNIENDTPAACGGASGNIKASVPLHGADNVDKAFHYFIDRGLTPAQSAGIVGNLIAESNVDPNIAQGGGGPGRGIMQWSVGDRWDTKPPVNGRPANVKAFAASPEGLGRPMNDLSLQLDFAFHELTYFYAPAFADIRAAQSAGDAAFIFMSRVEIPKDRVAGGANDNKRRDLANQVLHTYGGGGGGSIPGATTNTGAPGSCVNSGGGVTTIVQKAIELAWPEPYASANPKEPGRTGPLAPTPAYDAALTQFNAGARAGNNGADCGAFVATVMRASGADPNYPGIGTTAQYAYLTAHPEKYQILTGVQQAALVPGDILIVTAAQHGGSFGHTWIYIGPQASGYFAASASLNDRAPNQGRETLTGFTVARMIK